jgi:hypothetical protein
MCIRFPDKNEYSTYYEAQKVLSILKPHRVFGKRRRAHKMPKRIYKCPHCGKYHLTSKK